MLWKTVRIGTILSSASEAKSGLSKTVFPLSGRWFGPFIIFLSMFFSSAEAFAETRTLRLYFVHTNERAEITFKRNGRFQQDGLNKLNRFLRDWRRNEPTKMDPRLFDLVWQIYDKVGGRDYIHVVSAYRSPATNSMLRSRSRGVARKSQHMLGKAMDWYLPGVRLATLRATALRYEAGGVGYYPRSGSPFIHTDVGNVRHWPRMSRKELLAVFPDGKTIHVPSDGRPLPGYEQAVAAYEARRRSGSSIQIASSSSGSSRKGKTLFGLLFGGGADEEEDSSESSVAVASNAKPSRAVVKAPAGEEADDGGAAAPATAAQPQPQPAAPPATATQAAPELPARIPQPVTAPRQEAPAPITAEDNAALAFAVPVPLRRPDYAPTPAPGEPSTLTALAQADAAVAVPEPRPEDSASAIRELIAANVDEPAQAADESQPAMANALVPVPFDKPKQQDMKVASVVPGQRPVLPAETAPAADQDVITVPDDSLTPEAIIAQADVDHDEDSAEAFAPMPTTSGTTGGRLQPQQNVQMAAVQPQTSLRRTMLEAKGDPVAMLDSGVKTTAKKAKPHRQLVQGQTAKAIQVSSDLSDRALSSEQVAEVSPEVVPAVLRNGSMRKAPTTVYTAGFQQSLPVADANKFTGKAVTFMQIARFQPTSGM
ncbi:MAG: DUF882 domain-containing protein [Phyllobacterium sp.]|uniref:DUF882 domain-containing protein n=1 Tax=Phyllobacterium sp. TaxID=1871046 RepID=UPI0030F21ED7